MSAGAYLWCLQAPLLSCPLLRVPGDPFPSQPGLEPQFCHRGDCMPCFERGWDTLRGCVVPSSSALSLREDFALLKDRSSAGAGDRGEDDDAWGTPGRGRQARSAAGWRAQVRRTPPHGSRGTCFQAHALPPVLQSSVWARQRAPGAAGAGPRNPGRAVRSRSYPAGWVAEVRGSDVGPRNPDSGASGDR